MTLLDAHHFETPAIWTTVAADYSALLLPIFERYAVHGLQLADPSRRAHALDLACGPGSLTLPLSERVAQVTAVDFSPTMLDCLRARLTDAQRPRVSVHQMDGHQLTFEDATFDAVMSMFGVVHFADPQRGLKEMARVARPGAPLLISTWAAPREATVNELTVAALRHAFDDLPGDEAIFHSFRTPPQWAQLVAASGFVEPRVESLEIDFELASPEAYWQSMSRASVPLLIARQQCSEERWQQAERRILDFLHAQRPWPRPVKAKGYFVLARRAG